MPAPVIIVIIIIFGVAIGAEQIYQPDINPPESTPMPIVDASDWPTPIHEGLPRNDEMQEIKDVIINELTESGDEFETEIINNLIDDNWPQPPKDPCPECGDPDPDQKGGGKDPFVLEGWDYIELGDGYKCSNSPNPFDYDNDGFREHMCYWYSSDTRILFSDKYEGKLVNGTNFEAPFTHIWQDSNSNILVDKGELLPIKDPILKTLYEYPWGELHIPNQKYIYCEMYSPTLKEYVYCTLPTYWMRGI